MSLKERAVAAKIALVTGASRGIGRAIAERLAAEGMTVIGTATGAAGVDAISDYLARLDNAGSGMLLQLDEADSVPALLAGIDEKYAPPTVLVNNAGITRDTLLMRMREEEWHAVINTNLTALYRLCKACARGMTRARWGRIITISSVVGAMGNPGQSNYAASKAGAEGFARALARELGARNITVNCVAPGFIDTDMTRALSEQQRTALLEQIPLARLGRATEVAALVAFLAGEQGAYITGETVHINGGLYMS